MNKYLEFMGSDNALCLPVIDGKEISMIPAEAAYMAGVNNPENFPQLILDLEQIQVLDYTKIPLNTEDQISYIQNMLRDSPYEPEDLAFLALKSLYSFSWNKLETQNDFVLAMRVEAAFIHVIKKKAESIASELIYRDALLPYWVRLSYLRVMSKVPEPVIQRSSLKAVTCFPIKRKSFNAYSAMLKDSSIIGFNYALEPILKILNRFFIHYYTTQHLAGPNRYERAWNEISSVVRYFSGKAGATELIPCSLLLSIDDVKQVHSMTADQIDFIMMHEMGHIYHEHPKMILDIIGTDDEREKRQVFELEADNFSHRVYKSWFIESPEEKKDMTQKLNAYAGMLESVELLFIYTDFINRAKNLINTILGDDYFSTSNVSHPLSEERLAALHNNAVLKINSAMVKYAKEFFENVLNHVKNLEIDGLGASLKLVSGKKTNEVL